jgi:predicted AlkP superfamily pyrophosphatase or phosphodiesterase
VNYLFVADHGMTAVDTTHPVRIPLIDTAKAVVVSGGELAHIYVKQPADIPALYGLLKAEAKDFNVILKKDVPSKLHYGANDDTFNRIGDILLIPDWPYTFVAAGAKPKAGAHGYDPYKVEDMRTVFYAWGPAFKKGKTVGSIQNVDVYPVVANLLGLNYDHKIDGNKKLARKILKRGNQRKH